MYTQQLNLLTQKGQELLNPAFRFHPADQELLNKLIAYFLRDEEQVSKYQISLRKGLLLTGPVGCGKTSIMTLLRLLLPQQQRHNIKSCREVAFEFEKEGHQVINKYSGESFASSYPIHYDPRKPSTYCFDDLGTENSIKHFGTECNVMGEILLSRYDYFISNRMFTHATTNLSATELETLYGNRVRSRMREMFNLISFPATTADKRA